MSPYISMSQNDQMNFILREKMEYLASSLEKFLRMTVMWIKKKQEQK